MWAQIAVVVVLIVLLLVCLACLLTKIRAPKPDPLDQQEPIETDASYDAIAADYRRRLIDAGYRLPPSTLGSHDGQEL